MESHVIEWLNLAIRWAHIVTGIAWIGASFYFNWLENSLNRKLGLSQGIAGNLWAIHGGGFYYIEKYKVAPKELPETLHWFKWEAYFTWITGFLLLSVVYYFNAKTYLIDKSVFDINSVVAISIGIGSLIVSWFLYDVLCKTRVTKSPLVFFVICFLLVVALSYFFSMVFSARGAFIHVGAVLGTLMAANVFFVIIPSQKALVRAAKKNEDLDASLGIKAGRRSLHNNYMTLPVLFIMISNHFPSTFGHSQNWLVLAGIMLAGIGIRHYFNLKGRQIKNYLLLPASALGLFALAFVTSPNKVAKTYNVTDDEAISIISTRCVACHSIRPSDPIFAIAPNGVTFDTLAEILKWKNRIHARAVVSKTMPLLNQTGMTKEERIKLGDWISEQIN